MGKLIDLTGQRFGRLVVIELAEMRQRKSLWRCRCDCGEMTIKASHHLKEGVSRSCGCLRTERSTTHGKSGTRLYRIWQDMKTRCRYPSYSGYKNYGGRGICICAEWEDFAAFQAWALANGYKEHLTIDRINVNGNYEPSNCRWATMQEQAHNKRAVMR